MRFLLKCVSTLGLVLTIIPALLVFLDAISWNLHTQLMTVGMVVWFISAPIWMKPSRR